MINIDLNNESTQVFVVREICDLLEGIIDVTEYVEDLPCDQYQQIAEIYLKGANFAIIGFFDLLGVELNEESKATLEASKKYITKILTDQALAFAEKDSE